MKHPNNRSERRHNGIVWRNRQRFIMKNCWWSSRNDNSWFLTNNMWWGRKQTTAHGNRCFCHEEKRSRKEIRKRREALDDLLLQALQEENTERLEQGLGEIILC